MFNRYKCEYKLVFTTRNDNIHKFKRFVIISYVCFNVDSLAFIATHNLTYTIIPKIPD